MNDSIPNDLRPPIDARHLVTREAVFGAIRGFCWSLLAAVPMAALVWERPFGGPVALVVFGSISSVSTAAGALVGKRRAQEKMLTNEHRAVLRYHIRRTETQALCISGLLIALAAAIRWQGSSPSVPVEGICVLIIFAMIIASDFLGRARGIAAVRKMQQEAHVIACRIDDEPLVAPNDAPLSTLVQPSIVRFTETRPAAPLEDD